MHAMACVTVDEWLAKSAACPDGSMWLLGRNVVAGVQIVACCSENVPGKDCILLRTLTDVKNATYAQHGLAIRYMSKIPRVISISGRAVNEQVHFVDEHDNTKTAAFGKECSTQKLRIGKGAPTCAEIAVRISLGENKGIEESIQGNIRVFRIEGEVYPMDASAIDYELRLAAK